MPDDARLSQLHGSPPWLGVEGPAPMSYREALPQVESGHFLTDAGMETWLVFQRGIELPEFAAFDLLKEEAGTEELRSYYERYLELASRHGAGFILEAPTWRANPRWAKVIGYDEPELRELNEKASFLMEELRAHAEPTAAGPIVISGCVGPHDDGYDPSEFLSVGDAERYHSEQVGVFAETAADMVSALTMTYAEEAIGIVRAARAVEVPVVISFTLETDGRLPSGQSLGDAIDQVDEETGSAAAYFMINCAHPTHFERVLDEDLPWLERIRGLRANASTRSHAELDEATELDDGDPADLGVRYAVLKNALPNLSVLGGCSGTDHRHVAAISDACFG